MKNALKLPLALLAAAALTVGTASAAGEEDTKLPLPAAGGQPDNSGAIDNPAAPNKPFGASPLDKKPESKSGKDKKADDKDSKHGKGKKHPQDSTDKPAPQDNQKAY